MDLVLSDEMLATFMPILVYWIYSGIYMFLDRLDKYRLHTRKEEDIKNLVSKRDVVKGVLLQQSVQATFALLAFKVTNTTRNASLPQEPSLMLEAWRFFVAMVVFDSWQYFMHRYMHYNKFLYRRFHSRHHRLIAPYAFAAQYNHPIDGLLIETLSGASAFLVSGMSPRTCIFFFSFATIKGIDDHCGLLLPGNFFHLLFQNNTAFHDLHHQISGSNYNFSQPFFVVWDKIFGTYMPHIIQRREVGGFEARIVKN